MKVKEDTKKLNAMDVKDLQKELENKQRELVLTNLKFRAGKMDNYSEIKKLKKTVARIHTILYNKTAGEENGK